MRLLHTADLHLGQIMYQYYSRTEEHEHFFEQLIHWCGEYNPDALLVSGDIFDIQQPSALTREYFNTAFARLHRLFPQMAIVITAGNHDSASRIEADSAVWALSDVTLVGRAPMASQPLDRFIVELPSGFVVAMPFMVGGHADEMQKVLDRVAERNTDGRPVVMMAHAAIEGCDYSGHDDIGNYLALGHIHRPQTIGRPLNDENSLESSYQAPVMRYSGSALHVSCDEKYPHSVSLVDIDSHGGEVSIKRLHIDQLIHFYILPENNKPALMSDDELNRLLDDFCATHDSGYIRLRVNVAAQLPPDFITGVYERLEASGKDVRLNPKIIFEGVEAADEHERPLFQMAELQQMDNPLDFIEKIIDQFPNLTMEQLNEDFKELRIEN